MTDASHTPQQPGDGFSDQPRDPNSWDTDATGQGSTSSDAYANPDPLGAYGSTSSSPYSSDASYSSDTSQSAAASPYDQGSLGASSPYDQSYSQGSVGTPSPYDQGSAATGSPYSQGSVGTPSPYDQGSVGTPSPYGQTSSTNPYLPDQPQVGAPAAQSPYAQPAPVGAPSPGYGAPGQQMPGAYAPGQPAPYMAQPYTPGGPSADGSNLNILGLISIIVGGLGVLLMIIGGAAIFFGLVGLVLGILGLVLAKFKHKKGLAIAGTITSSVALLGGIASIVIFSTVLSATSSSLSDYNSASYPVTVTISVTSTDATSVDIDYNVTNGKSDENSFETSNALFSEAVPFETTIEMNINDTGSDYSRADVSVTTDSYDDSVTCEITVNDKVLSKDTSTGYASCYVSGIYAYLDGADDE